MKCLEKDRTRRYETANGLAVDIQRHLNNEPVVACPPSAAYRFQKLVRRNKLAFTAVCAVAATLLLGLSLSTWLWLAEREARGKAVRAEQVARESEAQMKDMVTFFRNTQINRTVAPKEFNAVSVGSSNNMRFLVLPGDPRLKGKTYAQWAAAWWKWGMELPKTNSAGGTHPWDDYPRFDLANSPTAAVWFLAAPFGTNRRSYVIPSGKALFFPLICMESSSLEAVPYHGDTANDQAAIAQYWVDHMIETFCEVDGIPLSNLTAHRVQSPQININVPAPWILGAAGGKGTSSGDGYFVFLSPLVPGQHTLHYGGSLRFTKPPDKVELSAKIDMTYIITVAAPP